MNGNDIGIHNGAGQAQIHFLECMEQINRVIQDTVDIEEMMQKVLDAVLSVMEGDRSWLLFPCDPSAPSWQVRMIRTKPEYAIENIQNVVFPVDEDAVYYFGLGLSSSLPICAGTAAPGKTIIPLAQESLRFGVKSQIFTAVYPKTGKPWLFGIHQCSYPRVWTEEEQQLFQSIGCRIGDALGNLLLYRDLKESEAFLQSIYDGADLSIAVVDPAPNGDLLIAGLNAAYERSTGVRREEAIGKKLSELLELIAMPSEDIARHCGKYSKCLASGEALQCEESVMIRGQAACWMTRLAPLKNTEGKIYRIIVTMMDVTEHKKLEEQLLQAQKMETVGLLAGGIAHDFNNMLSPIIGYSEIMAKSFSHDTERAEKLRQIKKAALRAKDLTQRLLAFSRKQIIELKPTDLGAMIRQIQGMLRSTLRENIHMEISIAPSLHLVQADVRQLDQVLLNLAVNAQDAMPNGGLLTIEAKNTFLDESYANKHAEVTPGPYVMLTVSDTGIGMDKQTIQHIFEPFFTTKELGKGTGLGLSTVYGIVKRHQGSINAYSEEGIGSSFKVYLPALLEGSAATERNQDTVSLVTGTETILIAEDDEMVRTLASEMLEDLGYKVLAAKTPKECLALAGEYKEPIHLLLTDVVMPAMNGKQLFESLRGSHPDMKVLFMSGYTCNVIAHHGVLNAGIHFLEKPFSLESLSEKVRQALS